MQCLSFSVGAESSHSLAAFDRKTSPQTWLTWSLSNAKCSVCKASRSKLHAKLVDADYLSIPEHPNLHLSPEERRLFGQLFSAADTEKIGVVTGEVAVKFFEKTRLPSDVLGEVGTLRTGFQGRADTGKPI